MKQTQTQFNKHAKWMNLVTNLFVFLFSFSSLSAQVSTLKLSTTDATRCFDITNSNNASNNYSTTMGSGTTTSEQYSKVVDNSVSTNNRK